MRGFGRRFIVVEALWIGRINAKSEAGADGGDFTEHEESLQNAFVGGRAILALDTQAEPTPDVDIVDHDVHPRLEHFKHNAGGADAPLLE